MLRVTFASPKPIPDALVDRVRPEHLVRAETTFGHVVHTYPAAAPDDSDLPESDEVAVGVIRGELAEHDAQLLLLDVDSTLTTTEAIDLLAEHAGKGKEVAAITEAAMRGELDFAESLRRRVATLEGLPLTVLDEVAPRMTLSPGARELIALAKERGARVGVTSGGFTRLIRPLAEELGLDFVNANHLEAYTDDGVDYLTGFVAGKIVDREQKARDLHDFAEAHGVPLSRAVAVGDGANDLLMLDAAGIGIAYRAKPVTASRADVAINFPRLDAVGAFAFPES